MLERNRELIKEQDKLEKGRFKGQTLLHWVDGVVKILDFPKKPFRKELKSGAQKEEKKDEKDIK